MKVSDYIVNFLVENKIDKVFSYIGKNAHICDSIDKNKNIENIFTIHEQGCGFSAEGYARATGKTGVATATSGPGATNLVTAVADCYFDSIPSIFIVGDVPPYECKQNRDIRQFGFQETDIVSICKPITKYATAINSLDELRYKLEKAYFLSRNGRKGPIVISLPENLQFRIDFNPKKSNSFFKSKEYELLKEKSRDISRDIKKTIELINSAKRPLILVGGGVRLSNGVKELREFLKNSNIPIVYSLMGKDAISDEYKYNLGFIGNFGTRYANLTIANSDLLIVLGSRLDNLQTGRKIETFARGAKIIQVDIDRGELGIRMDIDLAINYDIKEFLIKVNKLNNLSLNIKAWQEKVLEYKKTYPINYTLNGAKKIGNSIISKLSKELRDDDIICVDVGEHQMLVAQSLKVKNNQRVLFSGGFGAMGFALPSAIGATIGTNRRAIIISGDGGFQMNIQELEIIKRRNLPIKIFIINNNSLHMVKLRQDTYLEGNSVGSKKDYSVPNFKKIGKAYGIESYRVSKLKNIKKIFKKSLKNDEAQIIDIEISADMTTVEPRLDFNRAFEDMKPYLSRDDLKKQMLIKLV